MTQQEENRRPGQPVPGVHLGENASVSDSHVIGGSVSGSFNTSDSHNTNSYNTTHNTHKHKQRNAVLLILVAILLIGGGTGVYFAVHGSSSKNVVFEEGLQGATDTANALRQAEMNQDSDQWCYLASATSGDTCRNLMANSFSAPSSKRSQLSDVQLGAATGSSESALLPVLLNGKSIGELPLSWTGSRWELNTGMYPLAINDGGVLMAALESGSGCGALLGIPVGC